MKGQLLSRSHSSHGLLPDILSVVFTHRHEWDPRNVIVTGCADGVIRVRFPPLRPTAAMVTLRTLTDSLAVFFFNIYIYFFGLSLGEIFIHFQMQLSLLWRWGGGAATWMSIQENNNHTFVVDVIAHSAPSLVSKLNCKLGFTQEWAPIMLVHLTHTHTNYVIAVLLPRVMGCACVRHCICECACYYVELHLIFPLVMCLSHRYGRQSTPEHNYLALQKSPYPQGKTERRETVMARAVRWEYSYRFCVYNNTEGSCRRS